MQSFTTENYEFEVDGKTYVLPEINIDSFERIGALYEIKNPVEQVAAFRDALLAEADDETAGVIRKLALRKVAMLFRGWTGIGGGDDAGEDGSSSAS